MSAFREPGFKERQEAAAKAKQAVLDKLRARQNPGGPAAVQQETARVSRAKKPSTAKDTRATEKAQKQPAGEAAPKAARKPRKK
jgi:hypothetical protein